MKILHIVPLISDTADYGGPVRGTLRQSVEVAGRGHSSEILSLWRGDGDAPQTMWGIDVRTFKFHRVRGHRFAGGYSLPALIWVFRNMRKFDVVHAHAGRDLWVILSMILLRMARIPFVVQTHGMLNPRQPLMTRLYDLVLTRPALKGAMKVLYLTKFESKQLSSFASPRQLFHVVNGIDAGEMRHASVESLPMKIVFCSRIESRKKLVDLVDAVVNLRREGIDLELDIYGPDEGALGAAQAAIVAADAQTYVRYLGSLSYELVRPMLRNYDVFALPSINEPFPNALLEALATGLACVCTSSCGLAPYVEAHQAGIVVSPGTAGLESALRSLYHDPAERLELGQRALSLVEEEFSMESVGTRLLESYTP